MNGCTAAGCRDGATNAVSKPRAVDAFDFLTTVPWAKLRPVLDWPKHSMMSETAAQLDFSLIRDATMEGAGNMRASTGMIYTEIFDWLYRQQINISRISFMLALE